MPTIHPRLNDQGMPVQIQTPSAASSEGAWLDAALTATAIPGGWVPDELNGLALASWNNPPSDSLGWNTLSGINQSIAEPPLVTTNGKKLAAGAVVVEPDGRVWLVHPTNGFGGYAATFPKGRIQHGLSAQATAIREVWEESGLRVRILSWLGDFERTTTMTRLFMAERVGGSPADMGWESQAVSITPLTNLGALLKGIADQPVLAALRAAGDKPRLEEQSTVANPGGYLVRTLQAIDGFYATYDHWPTRLQMDSACLTNLVCHHLSPLGFYRLQVALKLEVSDGSHLVALDESGRTFDYNENGWDIQNDATKARHWLGLDD